jgi:hypothetical protein
LNDHTKKTLGIKQAAVVWIDCDLYESTVPALNFITDFVQTGTIICFDDFYCFRGDPNRGESKAFKEWLLRNPKITAIEYRKFEAVSGHSKPATKGRMKTSHFEGSIASWAAWAALGRNERTQRELATFDFNFGGQWLVQPADCA